MPEPRPLRHPPIAEAIIDFRVKARPGFDPQEFSTLKPKLADRFPKMDERRAGKVIFQFAPAGMEAPIVEDVGLQGLAFRSADEKLLAQFRADGFTLNQLKPYPGWGNVFPIAVELWKLYCSVARPEGVTRLALRYINRIAVPQDLGEFERYMRAAPVVPPELPQDVSAFFTRVTIHASESELAAHVAQSLGLDMHSQSTLVLDIDAFREGSWVVEDPLIESTFRGLRELKNLIFFNSLTEEALREFQ
jgi:uncharacterized protein (TIGR04255 family)